jgi:hypothetical protein
LEIVKKIGEGGSGAVYLGRMGDVAVAVKELKKKKGFDSADDEKREEQLVHSFQEFQRECFIMSRVRHPNLVKFYGISLRPTIQMVMEYCGCGDLCSLINLQQEASLIEEYLMVDENGHHNLPRGYTIYVTDPSEVQTTPDGMVRFESATGEQRGRIPLSVLSLKSAPLPDDAIPFSLRIRILYDIARGTQLLCFLTLISFARIFILPFFS